MFPRPSFVATQTSGFGGFQAQTPAAPFGQTQLFGNTSSSFGTSNAFANNSTPIFGQAQSSAPLFGGTNTTPAFGQPQTGGFGTSLFGQQQQQPASSGLFGSTNTFGQQSKPTGFGYGSTPSTGLFGQPAQQQNSLFQTPVSNNVFGSSSFGSNMQSGMTGTVVKFTPVTSTDSMQRSGIAHAINTKHHCITIMKEYENKSFEELRYEDYQAGRKGPQQQSGFAAPQPFATAASSAPTLFGQTDQNKTVFGQSGFGQSTGFGVVQPTTPNLFGKPSTSTFGTTVTTASSFGFGTTPSTNLFGNTSAPKPFGTQPTPNLFGQTPATQQPAFGSSIFGQPSTQSSTLFGKPAQQPSFGQTSTSGFQFGQTQPTQTSTLFQQPKPATGFGFNFGQTSTATTAPFGQPQQQQSFGGFGTNTFGKPFGQTQQQTSGFGTGIGMQNTSLFGNNAAKPGGLFGNTGGSTGLFNSSFTGSTFGGGQQPQMQQQITTIPESHPEEIQKLVSHFDVYGRNIALEGLTPMKPQEVHYVTNPKDIQAILDQSPTEHRISTHSQRINVLPPKIKTSDLFDKSLDDTGEKSYYMRSTSARRLVLKKKPDRVEQKMDEIIAKCLQGQTEASSNISLLEESKNDKDNSNLSNKKDTPLSFAVSTPREKLGKQILFTQDDKDKSDDEHTFEDAVGDQADQDPNKKKKGGKKIFQRRTTYGLNNNSQELEVAESQTSTSPSPPVGFETVLRENKIVGTNDSCGVVLTRQGYYTIPPLDKLHEYMNSEGRCIITGLTIGRLGFGNVYFLNDVDVTDLNLDEIVHFQHRVLTIYPDDDNKPEVGKGLNQEAQITLDNVYPKNNKNNEILNPKGMDLERFLERLQLVSARIGGEFKEYRPETGSWVFNVPHFTKYGINDDETKCDPNTSSLDHPFPLKAVEGSRNIPKSFLTEGASPKLKMDFNPISGDYKTGFVSLQGPMLSLAGSTYGEFMIESDYELEKSGLKQFKERNDDILHTMHDEDSKIDRIHDPFNSSANFRDDLYKPDSDAVFLMKNTLFKKEYDGSIDIMRRQEESMDTMDSFQRELESSSKNSSVYLIENVEVEHEKQLQFFKLVNPHISSVPLQKSLITGRNYMDLALFKSRSMKAGWAGDCTVKTTLPIKIDDPTIYNSSSLATMQIYNTQSSILFDSELLNKHMEIVLKYVNIDLVNATPYSSIHLTKLLLKEHCELAQKYPKNKQGIYYKSIWNLLEAFWDSESHQLNRKERFSNWLENIVNKDVENDQVLHCKNVNDVTNNILALLSGHKIEQAASLAMENNMPQLSMLLAQINSTSTGKLCNNRQVHQWFTSLAADKIDDDLFKIYSILAGMTHTDKANICADLDWKRALAIHLWYVAPSSKPISYVLAQYEDAFNNFCYARRPSPIYDEESVENFDLLYHIMTLHVNKTRPLEKVLNTFTYTNDSTDYTLSWLLLIVFQSLQIGTISEGAINHIHINFASQLEAVGLHNWAIFVLSFIKDYRVRKNMIMNVLYRHIDTENVNFEMESELVGDMRVSAMWIHHIKANKCIIDNRYWEAYTHLSLTQRWIECHEIAIQHLLPTLLVNELYDEMKTILYPIASGCDKIPNWKNEGGLILEFLQLRELVCGTTELDYKERYLDVNEDILSIIRRFSEFPTSTPELSLCVTEMSRKSVRLLNKLLKDVSPAYAHLNESANYHIGDLVMPTEYKVELILTVLRKHLQEKHVSK